MHKIIFFLLAVISLSAYARANWNPYSMNHERFVHLSEHDKHAVLVSTMELMVELESKYQKEVVSSGFSTERLQKYVQVLQKLQSLILGNAYAADPGVPLTKLATQFSELLKTLSPNGCIYGGYVSIMGTFNKKKYCRHPSTMRSNIPAEASVKKAYLTRGTGANACVAPAKITCNPVIFGYTDKTATTPLCVETSYMKIGKAHNVSYECMRKALAEPGKDDRLSVLAKAMSENKEAFNKVHSFIFRTCACDDKDKIINADYAVYMKPHRTCYGLMNTLRIVNNNECEQITNVVAGTEFANDWTKYFGEKANYPDLAPERSGDFDQIYGSLMAKDEVKAICDGVPVKIPVDDRPTDPVDVVTPEPDKSEWVCTTTCSVKEPVPPETEKRMNCEVISAGWNLIKAGATKPAFTDAGIKGQKSQIDDIKQTIYKVKVKDPAKPGAELELECRIIVATEEEAPPSCSIAVAPSKDDATKSTATVTISGKDKEKAVVVWIGGTADPKLPNEITVAQIKGATQDVSVTFTIEGAAAILPCKNVIPALTETDPTKPAYVIKATAESELATSVKVNAVISIDGKEEKTPANYKISWTRKGTGVAKLPKIEEEKDKKEAGVQDTPTEEVIVETPTVVAIAGEVATGDSITETRVAEIYEACASLFDDKGTSVAGPSCAPIPAIKAEKTNPYQNTNPNQQQNQPPQQFFFNQRNTFTPGF